MRRLRLPVFLALLAAPAGRALADGDEPEAPPRREIFFKDPDKETAAQIAKAITQMATGSLDDRRSRRRELESIGYWSVEPLIEATAPTNGSSTSAAAPPTRCAAILVLDAIHDRRAVDPLRAVVVKEASLQYLAGFAALSLGRFHDVGAVDAFRAAFKPQKSPEMLRAAAAFALAKIRTNEARDLLVERLRAAEPKETVRSAELLALGFFPEAALGGPNNITPGPELAAGLTSDRRGERQAALLGFLVAAGARGDVKSFLRDLAASKSAPDVARIALIGLSRSQDSDVGELLAKTAEHQGDDRVRELAADLLVDRVDSTTKPAVEQIARGEASARLRAACILALGRLDDDDAHRLVLDRLADHAPIVRAAAAVALTRRLVPGAREAALAAVEARLKRGETNEQVHAVFEQARAVLAGDRGEARWIEIGPDVLFSEMPLTYTQRLLREVNLQVMASLDLAKIHNLQNDSEVVPNGPPGMGSDAGQHDGSSAAAPSGGGTDAPPPAPPSEPPLGQPAPSGPGLGMVRTSQYQELRDLKVELVRDPYFGPADPPSPPTTPGAK